MSQALYSGVGSDIECRYSKHFETRLEPAAYQHYTVDREHTGVETEDTAYCYLLLILLRPCGWHYSRVGDAAGTRHMLVLVVHDIPTDCSVDISSSVQKVTVAVVGSCMALPLDSSSAPVEAASHEGLQSSDTVLEIAVLASDLTVASS